MTTLRRTLIPLAILAGTALLPAFGVAPVVETAKADPIQVCVTDPFTFNLNEGDCGPEKSWVEVNYTHPGGLFFCINTRLDDELIWCDPRPPAPTPPPAECPGADAGQLAAFEARPVFSPGFKSTRTLLAANVLPGESLTVTRHATGNPKLDAQPTYARLLFQDSSGLCRVSSPGATNDGYVPVTTSVTFVMVGDPADRLGGTFYLQHLAWEADAPLTFGAARDSFAGPTAN